MAYIQWSLAIEMQVCLYEPFGQFVLFYPNIHQ